MIKKRLEVFDAFDRNRDGVISRGEWEAAYKRHLEDKAQANECAASNGRT